MMKVVRQYVADYDMAQDVLHDGFLIIISQIQNLRNPETLEYWMATIMKNLSIHSLSQIRFDDILQEPEGDGANEEIEEGLSYDELMTLVNQLPNGYRTVFRLAVLEGKSHQEIAEMLGITPHSSASQLARAKEKLRHLIIEHKRKAGLLTVLALLTGSTYLYYRNESRNVDTYNNVVAVEDVSWRISSDSEENVPVEVASTSSPITSNIHPNIKIESLPMSFMQEFVENIRLIDDSMRIFTETIDISFDTTIVTSTNQFAMREIVADADFAHNSHKAEEGWKVRIATNLLGFSVDNNRGDGVYSDSMQDFEIGGENYTEQEQPASVRHLMPITLGVRFSKGISPSWSVEFGLQYSLLRSDITSTFGYWSYVRNVRANYLSTPVEMNYNFIRLNRANMYVSGGLSLDIPVGATIGSGEIYEREKLRYPISISPVVGLGFEYKITPSSMLFVQPSLNYHLMKKSDYPILWQDKPVTFELPIGIRISW
jgi:RNA polymerase sigma factor (sigma-70 family)